MSWSYIVQQRPRIGKLVVLLGLLAYLLTTGACGGDAQVRQQATDSQQHFAKLLQHAQSIGVPSQKLQSIQKQEQQLKELSAPANPLDDKPIDDYHRSLKQRYVALEKQLQDIIKTSTVETRTEAQTAIEQAQTTQKKLSAKDHPAKNFVPQLQQLQDTFKQAELPRDFIAITVQAQKLQKSLLQLSPLATKLKKSNDLIVLSDDAKLNTTPWKKTYAEQQELFKKVAQAQDVDVLEQKINEQQLQMTKALRQVIPNVTMERIKALEQNIQQLPKYNVNADPFLKQLDVVRSYVRPDMGIDEYQKFIQEVNEAITQSHMAGLRGEGRQMLKKFHQDANTWGQNNAYYDAYNNRSYPLNAGYLTQGIGENLDADIEQASTMKGLEETLANIKNIQYLFEMMKKDTADNTAYNQPHAAERQLMSHFQLSGQVVLVSLAKQTLRVYQNGKLIRAAYVTTGRFELPTIPGIYSVLHRLSPTKFKSPFPEGSPYWYPPTDINHAVLFRDGGYFIHDAPWRFDYGPGTQFPHSDSSGDQQSSGNGSHGCVNLPPGEASWFFNNTGWNTKIVVY